VSDSPVEPPSGSEGFSDGAHAPFVVPDDARELARDVEAWRREERWARRRRRFERLFFMRRARDRGVPAPVVALVLISVALFGATITFLTPHGVRPMTAPVALRLAAPAAPPGTTGGLLPDDQLSTATGVATARDLRPGLIAILGPDCDCAHAVAALSREASLSALAVYLVGKPAQTNQVDQLIQISRSNVHGFIDSSGRLIAAYAPHGLTVVPVHADGVTDAVVRDYTDKTPLGAVLVSLKQAGPQ
jgi:hypothetical protein